MEKIVLNEINIDGINIDKLNVFLDDDLNIIVLPLLWSIYTNLSGEVFKFKKIYKSNEIFDKDINKIIQFLYSEPICEQTIKTYVYRLFDFFRYINSLNKKSTVTKASVHNSELIDTALVNYYLNSFLPKQKKSIESIRTSKAAISSYFNFLIELEIIDKLDFMIYRKTVQQAEYLNNRVYKIHYISKEIRSSILMMSSNKRDRLLFRFGFEVGLRTSENLGLVLEDFKVRNTIYPGIKSLIKELNEFPEKKLFKYFLSGIFTKGGVSRFVYLDRDLLKSIENYVLTERAKLFKKLKFENNHLFVRYDPQGKGKVIGKHHASKVFNKVISNIPFADKNLSYHDLRHTFATELYDANLKDKFGQETRSESAALINVQERLGHSSSDSTQRYISLRDNLLIIESEFHL